MRPPNPCSVLWLCLLGSELPTLRAVPGGSRAGGCNRGEGTEKQGHSPETVCTARADTRLIATTPEDTHHQKTPRTRASPSPHRVGLRKQTECPSPSQSARPADGPGHLLSMKCHPQLFLSPWNSPKCGVGSEGSTSWKNRAGELTRDATNGSLPGPGEEAW